MEIATRTFPKRLVCGLKKCIEKDAPLTSSERRAWVVSKEKDFKLFAPEHGGSYEIFNVRPIPKEIVQYCVEDVRILPKLWRHYNKLTPSWRERANEETVKRVEQSKLPRYCGNGRHMALASDSWK